MGTEPVIILDIIKTGIGVLTAFGVAIKPEQSVAIVALATAVLVALTAYTRSRVSSEKTVSEIRANLPAKS